MKLGNNYKTNSKSLEFDKIIGNLKKRVEIQNELVRNLNREIKPLKDRMEMVMVDVRRINSLLSPTFSISEIKKPEIRDENKKQLDDHLRGRVRFIIDGESVNIQIYVGEVKKLIEENPNVKKDSEEWRNLIQRISLEKSYKKLLELKPNIFDEYVI
jgi:hypothetical protein